MKKTLILFATALLCTQIKCDRENHCIIAMAAADGNGCTNDYLLNIYGQNAVIKQVPAALSWPMDFGQAFSQYTLGKKIAASTQPVIYHATCAGTAVGLCYAVDGKYRNALRGLVLEGMLASPNAAIQFRTSNADLIKNPLFPNKPIINYLTATFAHTTFGKYVYPQLLLPAGYCAFKESPLEVVSRLKNKELPIVIVEQHADDHAVPPTQSRAMYYRLRILGCKNAYLMQPNNAAHVDLIDPDGAKSAAIRRIMQGSATKEDRVLYQPNHLQFESDYTNLIQHDRQVRRVAKCTTLVMLCGMLYLAKTVIKR